MTQEMPFAYDQVLYPHYLHPQTHPDRLATMTKFFGVETAPVENCRVLELGCGTGGSLLSFAYDLPQSEFVGVDLSAKQIEVGNRAVRGIGLENLTLRADDIMNLSRESDGEFDYIIAHGVYSWVPEPVRDRILGLCREMLSEQGVAFVSYNAYPGSHYRNLVRDMMRFRVRNSDLGPLEKVNDALGVLKFITDSAASKKLHHEVLASEFELLTQRNYENIFHDELEEVNHPVHFYEFVEHAGRHDLQFVTETEYFTTKNVNFPREILDTLSQVTQDPIAVEQYLDFITNRRFRQSLVCRRELKIAAGPDRQVLRRVRIASALRPESERPELSTGKHEVFLGDKKQRVEIDNPLAKSALVHLHQVWPRTAAFDELVRESRRLVEAESGGSLEVTEKDEMILTEILFQVFCSGMIRLHIHEPRFATEAGERPLASPVARWQARENRQVSTLLSTSIQLEDPLSRRLLILLDGTRDRGQLVSEMSEFINSPAVDQPTEMKRGILRSLPEGIENNLARFAGLALLVA